jgi:phage protein D
MSGSNSDRGVPRRTGERESSVRRPRGAVRINGVLAPFLSATVTNRTHFSADVWQVELEPWRQPGDFGLRFWSDIDDAQVEVLFGLLEPGVRPPVPLQPESLKSLVLGQVDDIDIEPNDGRLMISGRDLSARLIDARTTNRWPNQTASQIVTEIAEAHDLIPDVTATKTPAGQFYKQAYSHLSRETPLWDIIVFLAEQEGFDAYVKGTTLYFGPPQAEEDPRPWGIFVERDTQGRHWSNLKRLSMRRSLTLSGETGVTVVSHSPVTGKTVRETWTRAGKHAPKSSASGYAAKRQSIVIVKPNLTAEQALEHARRIAEDITKFERTIDFHAEGDLELTVQRKVKLTGTESSFDQDYTVAEITWTLSPQAGLEMKVHAKNHDVSSSPTIA